MTRLRDRAVWLPLLVVVGLYAASFFLPAYDMIVAVAGWEAFVVVLQRPFESPPLTTLEAVVFVLGWLPNPLLWLGVGLFAAGRRRAAFAAGVIATVLGWVWVFDPDRMRPDFSGVRAGYYVWLSSMSVLAVASLWQALWHRPGR